MKVILFTHAIDIDGMGGTILSKLVYDDLTTVYCETENIDNLFKNYVLESKNEYDKIYIVDTCLGNEYLEIINNSRLKDKVKIFDHHINQIKQGKDKFSFVTLVLNSRKGMCSGTSLFYEYLLEKKEIEEKAVISDFVEMTRQYDTWEWYDKYKNELPHDMTILYDYLGNDEYVKQILEILNTNDTFKLNKIQKEIVRLERNKIDRILKTKLENIIIKNIKGVSCGIIFLDEYVNEARHYYNEIYTKNKVDVLVIINNKLNKIFYRAIDEFESVNFVLSQGGSGNKKTGSRNIKLNELNKIIDLLLN